MKSIKLYLQVLKLYLSIPFAFTNASKQRIKKEMKRLVMNAN